MLSLSVFTAGHFRQALESRIHMNEVTELLSQNGSIANISMIGATITFAWSAFKFLSVRAREMRARDFETYHRLIKELTESQNTNNYRQIAVLFELRFYPAYYPITQRILKTTMKRESESDKTSSDMKEEVESLIRIIEAYDNRLFVKILNIFQLFKRKT